MEDRFETFTVLIARISRSIRRLKAEEMERLGLKGPHVSCLYYLSLYDELTAAELCERCDEDKAAISRSIDYLEKNGYLTCGSGGARRYRSPLRLTEKGRDACRTIGGRIDAIVAEASAGLGAEERAVMYRALGTIGSRLEQIYDNRKQSHGQNYCGLYGGYGTALSGPRRRGAADDTFRRRGAYRRREHRPPPLLRAACGER